MSENTTRASANFEKLKLQLRELFELDKADLDFGIYRILRQRHREITEFLDQHLEKTVLDALSTYQTEERGQIEGELRKAEDAARAAGISPDVSPRVAELSARLTAGGSLQETSDEVYSHLYTFFSRYYSEGDFLGLQRSTVHGREKYMIPYNGEEVKMVWANMDQYYIKSSELLRDYRFRVRPSEGPLFEPAVGPDLTVEFKLTEGDTEKDNRKPDASMARAFQLDRGAPFEEIAPDHLRINFSYSEQPPERNLQEKTNTSTLKTLHDDLPMSWRSCLFSVGEDGQAVLQKHLRGYTARNQFDYFIHKDLGGFLRRELDFYIKNEIVYLDDIENSSAPKADTYLSKIRAIRRCGVPVIRMLAQVEDFQKKVWRKKKFVIDTRYCLTLDQVPESLYAEICANEAQWEEWTRLYDLPGVAKDLFAGDPKTPEFLRSQPHLMLDTGHFERSFVAQLLASIPDLDECFPNLCIHADNYHAMELIKARFSGSIECAYADPPYNTDSSPILYKNGYPSSTWATLVRDRITIARDLLTPCGMMCATIDDFQQKELDFILESTFGHSSMAGTVVIRANPSGRPTPTGFGLSHEYAIFAGKSSSPVIGKLPRSEAQSKRYNQRDEQGRFQWELFRKRGSESLKTDRPKQFFPFYCKDGLLRIPELKWDDPAQNYEILEQPLDGEIVAWPIDEDLLERRWRWSVKAAKCDFTQFKYQVDDSGRVTVYYKYRPSEDGVTPTTTWTESKYSATEHGTGVIKDLFGSSVFSYPKSVFAVADCLTVAGLSQGGRTLDLFGGSGTTVHAILNLVRADEIPRTYVLIEMEEYFETVLIPRIKKVVYSPEWKDGKPVLRGKGLSHGFKIIRLESYEDSLNNLRLQRAGSADRVRQSADKWQHNEYMLGYFLELESEGSASLLDVSRFKDPFSYKLGIATRTVGETKPTNVDLVETFNWLIGLRVKHIDYQKGFVTVTGEKKPGERGLIIWRALSDDPIEDNEALEKYLGRIGVNPADTEYAFIYVNGSHTLADPHNKIHLTEEEFQRRMFEDESFESLE